MFEYRKIENNETADVCKSCGKCCKNYPGAYHPEQFEDLSKQTHGKNIMIFLMIS